MKHSRYSLLIYIAFLLSVMLLLRVDSTIAQSDPTPFAPIIIQSGANVGIPEPFAVSEIAIRNGLSEWLTRGWSGAGIKIGVLDRGFGGLKDFINGFDVPINTAPGSDEADFAPDAIIHGTQVLETIHTLAPGAELFVCAYDNLPDFDLCVTWMIRAGVNIINHSVGVPALPLDGTNPWAQEVDRAARENILWVNAAGNFAQGYFTDRFTDTNANRLHEFRAIDPVNNEALGVQTTETSGNGVVMLSWSGYNGQVANAIDLDLQVIDATSGTIIGGSYDTQAGLSSDQPIEYFSFPLDRPYAVQVIDTNSNAVGVEFVLFIAFASVPTTRAQGSIVAPADSPNSLTVGALQGIRLAPYSSRGQLDNGQIGIDLVAPGEVQLRGGAFIGTSAAAPIVAASAALVWEANPNFTARDVRTYLENAASDDSEFAGRDNNYGFGILDLPLPNTSPTQVAVLPTSEPTSTNTTQPLPTVTNEPSNTPHPSATATDSPTNTPRPQATPTTSASGNATVTINVSSANLRSGPGTSYIIAGTASSGQTFDVIARYEDWYLIDRGSQSDAWVWSRIVNLRGSETQIEVAATIPPTQQSVSTTSDTSGSASPCNSNLNAVAFAQGPNGEKGITVSWNQPTTSGDTWLSINGGSSRAYLTAWAVSSSPFTIDYWTIDGLLAERGVSDTQFSLTLIHNSPNFAQSCYDETLVNR